MTDPIRGAVAADEGAVFHRPPFAYCRDLMNEALRFFRYFIRARISLPKARQSARLRRS